MSLFLKASTRLFLKPPHSDLPHRMHTPAQKHTCSVSAACVICEDMSLFVSAFTYTFVFDKRRCGHRRLIKWEEGTRLNAIVANMLHQSSDILMGSLKIQKIRTLTPGIIYFHYFQSQQKPINMWHDSWSQSFLILSFSVSHWFSCPDGSRQNITSLYRKKRQTPAESFSGKRVLKKILCTQQHSEKDLSDIRASHQIPWC